MSGHLSVEFALKTSSAKSIEDMLKKTHIQTYHVLSHTAIGWYQKIVDAYNEGCDILEHNDQDNSSRPIDLFFEVAQAKQVAILTTELGPEFADELKNNFGANRISHTLTSAFYCLDRAIDAEAQGKNIAFRLPNTNHLTVFSLEKNHG